MWLVLESRMLPENERPNILLNSMLEWKEPRLGFLGSLVQDLRLHIYFKGMDDLTLPGLFCCYYLANEEAGLDLTH